MYVHSYIVYICVYKNIKNTTDFIDVCGALVLQNQWMRTLLHAIRVIGSTEGNNLNLRL
jgi:hypothetical protein